MSLLPYTDTKPQGAADFYFAINATFRFMLRRFGDAGFTEWLTALGKEYFAPANVLWKNGGLPAVAQYWRDFFAAEPGSDVDVCESGDAVEIHVKKCPAISHLKKSHREIVPEYCRHCAILGKARAESAGLSMQLTGGNGSCFHRYGAAGKFRQNMSDVAEVR
ncbi:MAG: hypothetical protein WC959_03040 [Kiritimatiellales bacterium]